MLRYRSKPPFSLLRWSWSGNNELVWIQTVPVPRMMILSFPGIARGGRWQGIILPARGIIIPGARIAFALLAAMALTSLTACGGGSMNTDAMGTAVTASFAGATMPSAVAFQAGTTGRFQKLTLSGSSVSFTLPVGTSAYGFAYICPTFADASAYSNESIIQATTTDTTSLSLACPSLSGNISATFDVSAIPGATQTMMFEGFWGDQMFGTSGVQGLLGVPTGKFDVALVAMGANNTALGIQIQRGVNVTSSTSIAFPPMTAADELGSAPASITNVPSGASYDFETTYQTSGGLSAILPVSYTTGVPQTSYPTVPSSQSQSGDFYLIRAGAVLADSLLPSSGSPSAMVSSNTESAVTVALPSPLSSPPTAPTAAAFPTFNAIASDFTVAGTVVNSSWTQFQTSSTVYNTYTYVTQTWLGANTTFTVPDLSALTGFAPAPPSGGREFWSLYSTAGTPLQLNPVQQSGMEFFSSPMSVQSVQTAGAFIVP